ncbi:MAG TPA: alpha/beta fold hydrolase [Actinomycetes bacterium]|nr:alpha/beta fold hydrolase [Actinomycetes bacterium]
MTISRRAFLLGGGAVGIAVVAGGYELVQQGVLPGRIPLNTLIGACGDAPAVPNIQPGAVVSGSYTSQARAGTEVGWSIAYPPGISDAAKLPVCIAMHGRGGSNSWVFDTLSLEYYLADAVENQGVPPFAIASIDGGDSTNWHPRVSGDNPQAMVTDEFVPLLAKRGLNTEQLGLWGWSLGGYGALLLASVLGPEHVSAVVATSPALWRTAGETAPDTFDDAADFDHHNVFTREGDLDGIPIRIDIGDTDSFDDSVAQFRDELTDTPDGGVSNGCHDAAYWMRVAPAEIAFLGTHLAAAD